MKKQQTYIRGIAVLESEELPNKAIIRAPRVRGFSYTASEQYWFLDRLDKKEKKFKEYLLTIHKK